MNANAFRHFYDYHFTENRKIWDSYVMTLSLLALKITFSTFTKNRNFFTQTQNNAFWQSDLFQSLRE